MKKRFLTLSVIALTVLSAVTTSCEKEDNTPTGSTSAVFNSALTYGSMTDQDGNTYKTITIGTQTWMAENLRTTKYRNGDAIPSVSDMSAWNSLSTGAQCTYENTDVLDLIATYGRLYNWYAVSDSRNIAPTGWHVPTDAEWATLINALGGYATAGASLKEAGTSHWSTPSAGTNASGFTALPGGFRSVSGEGFLKRSFYGVWWSATSYVYDDSYAIDHILDNESNEVVRGEEGFKRDGFSVRLIKD